MEKEVTLRQIYQFLKSKGYAFEVHGNMDIVISNFSSPKSKLANSIYWINKKNSHLFDTVLINSIVITNVYQDEYDCVNKSWVVTTQDREVFFSILKEFFSKEDEFLVPNEEGLLREEYFKRNSIFVGSEVVLGRNVKVYPNVVIIGQVWIGDNSSIGPGSVIGTDGFGYIKEPDGQLNKVIHFGGVSIGMNVDIGANTCIDRGTLDHTIIGNNVKIDNLVHIAHNVIIEDNVSIIANSMIAGSCLIGENSHISPSSSILNKVSIAPNSFVGLGSIVISDVAGDEKVFGNPARKIP
jgi:UDP-3-O-[3-hydroxymyristoyl] glucosamine N-acyltransferase